MPTESGRPSSGRPPHSKSVAERVERVGRSRPPPAPNRIYVYLLLGLLIAGAFVLDRCVMRTDEPARPPSQPLAGSDTQPADREANGDGSVAPASSPGGIQLNPWHRRLPEALPAGRAVPLGRALFEAGEAESEHVRRTAITSLPTLVADIDARDLRQESAALALERLEALAGGRERVEVLASIVPILAREPDAASKDLLHRLTLRAELALAEDSSAVSALELLVLSGSDFPVEAVQRVAWASDRAPHVRYLAATLLLPENRQAFVDLLR